MPPSLAIDAPNADLIKGQTLRPVDCHARGMIPPAEIGRMTSSDGRSFGIAPRFLRTRLDDRRVTGGIDKLGDPNRFRIAGFDMFVDLVPLTVAR